MSEIVIEGQVVRQSVQRRGATLPPSALVPKSGTPPFVVVHHHEWEFVPSGPSIPEGGEWLAAVAECRLNPGSNGVGISGIGKDAKITPVHMLNGLRSKRSVVIEQHDPRLGEFADYMTKYVLDNGAWHYTYRWLNFVLINNGRNAVPQLDLEKMYGFRRKIVAAGLVDPMPGLTLDTHLHRISEEEKRILGLRNSGNMVEDAYRKRSQDLAEKGEAMRAAWRRQFGQLPQEKIVVSAAGDDGADEGADDPLAWSGPKEIEPLMAPAEPPSAPRRKRGD